ncbi:MAG: cytochrome c biogenesis protein CcdA [Pirellulales bacterium]
MEPVYDESQSASLAVTMLLAVLGGFLLNFMPCVLPVIGLKILAFVDQAGHGRKQVFLLNMVYSFGMLSVFWVLAALAIFANQGWGEQFQSVGFNLTLAGIVFVMALSFLGVWEIPLPGFATSKSMTQASRKEGYVGAFFKGIITTLLATPCSGPFLGTVIGFTLGQHWTVVATVFTCIGVGMSLPYLLIGAIPGLVKCLPKPGAWMDTFKQVMGFVLLGTVVFLFGTLPIKYYVPALATMIGLWFACWWVGRVPIYESFGRRARGWVEGIVVAGAVAYLSFNYLTPRKYLQWEPYSHEAWAHYTAEGRTVMIDFTADWCATAK